MPAMFLSSEMSPSRPSHFELLPRMLVDLDLLFAQYSGHFDALFLATVVLNLIFRLSFRNPLHLIIYLLNYLILVDLGSNSG